MIELGTLARKLKNEHCSASWRHIGKKHNVSPAMAFRIATQGYNPKSPVIRRKLGLPSMIPAPACPRCGIVHVKKRCDAGQFPRRVFDDPVMGGTII